MSRIPRICLVVALSFVLLAAVPAAHARTLAKPASSNSVIGNWLDAALSWVGSFVTGTAHGQTVPGAKTTSTGTSGSGSTTTMRPMTGTCIDPGGVPYKCPGV
jgi:hypothetical protein